MSALLDAVTEVARLAGRIAARHYHRGLEVRNKSDGSPVTIADREAEAAARDWIAARFPADGILGEEMGERAGTSGRRWLLDPIDGTASFIRGVPLWGSLVALTEGGGHVLAGAAAFPAAGEIIAAAPGEGCFHNGVRCRVSDVASLADATVLITDEHAFDDPARDHAWRLLARGARVSRSWGDCFGYLMVATGRAEVMVDPRLNPWDAACFVPIINEAGGRITDLKGGTPTTLSDAIATNRTLADEVRRLMNPGMQ